VKAKLDARGQRPAFAMEAEHIGAGKLEREPGPHSSYYKADTDPECSSLHVWNAAEREEDQLAGSRILW
jgi:hypothetical protein